MDARALVLVAPRQLEMRTLPVPDEPPVGGAILRVLANGLCGTDYEVYQGHRDPSAPHVPAIPGHEIVGRIAAIDPVARIRWAVEEGDRIVVDPVVPCGACPDCTADRSRRCRHVFTYSLAGVDHGHGLWGGMAEYVVLVPNTRFNRVPDHVSDDDAGLCNVFGNALEWTSVAGAVGLGQRVLVLGAGQRGLACAAVAGEAGAAQVIVTGLERDAHKLELAAAFGATDVVRAEVEDTVARVRELVDGEGVDLVVDTVPGATETVLHGIDVLRDEGTLVLAGLKGRSISGLWTDRIFRKRLTIRGANGASPWATENAMRLLARPDHPFAGLHTHGIGLDQVEWGLRVLGGEIDEPTIHITVHP